MLLAVVELAKADRPSVGRLEPGPAVSSRAHMCAFDRLAAAPAHAAVMTADPGAVTRAASIGALARRLGPVAGKHQLRHARPQRSGYGLPSAFRTRATASRPCVPAHATPAPRAG